MGLGGIILGVIAVLAAMGLVGALVDSRPALPPPRRPPLPPPDDEARRERRREAAAAAARDLARAVPIDVPEVALQVGDAVACCEAADAPEWIRWLYADWQRGAVGDEAFVARVQAARATQEGIAALVAALERQREQAPRLADPAYVELYGEVCGDEVLKDAHRIEAAVEAFHRDEPDVAAYLWRARRDLYDVKFWQLRAIDVAARQLLTRTGTPRARKRQPATEEQVRARRVRRLVMQLKDEAAAAAALDALGVREDEREQYLARFREQQRDHEEERHGVRTTRPVEDL
jgi:hypothetical protein